MSALHLREILMVIGVRLYRLESTKYLDCGNNEREMIRGAIWCFADSHHLGRVFEQALF